MQVPLAPSGRQKGAKPLVGLVSLASNRLKPTHENRPRATIFQPTNASQQTERGHRQILNFKIPVPTILPMPGEALYLRFKGGKIHFFF